MTDEDDPVMLAVYCLRNLVDVTLSILQELAQLNLALGTIADRLEDLDYALGDGRQRLYPGPIAPPEGPDE